MNLSNLLKYDGRINRLNFLLTVIGAQIVYAVFNYTIFKVFTSITAIIICLIPYSLLLYILACTSIKRAHDINKSGTMILFLLLPVINIFAFIYLLISKGDEVPNQFGPCM